jgi:hypothetical protein
MYFTVIHSFSSSSSSYNPLRQMHSLYIYIIMILYIYNHVCICVHLLFGSILHVWEKACSVCLSEPWLNIITSSSLHSPVNDIISFFMDWLILHCVCIYYIFLIHYSVFHSLVTVNTSAINMDVQVSLLYPDSHSFPYKPGIHITGLYGSSTFSF